MARKRHCAGCLSGGGKTLKLAVCARRVALVVIDLRTMKARYTGGRPFSFGPRPWCDVQAVASNAQAAFTWHACNATAVAVSREVAKHASLPRVGRAVLFAIGLRDMEGHYTGGRPFSFDARPWCDVQAVASNAKPAFAWHARKRHCGGCLSGGGETRKLAAHAPCHAG